MDLDEFILEQKEKLKEFEAWYRKMHSESPEDFPLKHRKENSGIWYEDLDNFTPGQEI